jgi:hypothetical protein
MATRCKRKLARVHNRSDGEVRKSLSVQMNKD